MKRKSQIIFIFFTIIFFVNNNCLADIAGYYRPGVVQVETKDYKIFHYHDFTYRRSYELQNINRFGPNAIFVDSLNTYSFISVIDKKSGDTLFKKPCPALTDITVSEDGKYIVGLSEIKLRNPYHLIVFEKNGKLVFKKAFRMEKKLNTAELKDYINTYPQCFTDLVRNGSISKLEDSWFINSFRTQVDIDSNYMHFVDKFDYTSNHSFPTMGGSVTNWVYWYDSDNPKVKLIETPDGNLSEIIISDIDSIDRTIYVNNESFNLEYFVKNKMLDKKYLNNNGLICNDTSYKKQKLMHYLQFGNLKEYYSTIDNFLEEDSLQYISEFPDSVSAYISSYTIGVVYSDESTYKKFEIIGNILPTSLKNEIRNLKGIKDIWFTDIEFTIVYPRSERTVGLSSFKYIIID